MDLHDLINKLDNIDRSVVNEDSMAVDVPQQAPAPVPEPKPSMSVNMNATGAEGMAELLNLISSISAPKATDTEVIALPDEEETEEAYANAPEPEEKDIDYMTNKLAGGMNKPKKTYDIVSKGDNPMQSAEKTEESIRRQLQKTLEEYKEN